MGSTDRHRCWYLRSTNLWFDILTKAKAPFIGEIKAGQHNETFPGYRAVNEQEGRLMSSATEEE